MRKGRNKKGPGLAKKALFLKENLRKKYFYPIGLPAQGFIKTQDVSQSLS